MKGSKILCTEGSFWHIIDRELVESNKLSEELSPMIEWSWFWELDTKDMVKDISQKLNKSLKAEINAEG